jgi:segregation and condensation protein B
MTTEEPTVDNPDTPPPEPGAPSHEVAARAEASGRSDEEASAELLATEAEPEAEPPNEAVPPVGEGHEAPERLKSIIESLLFASDKPLPVRRLVELTGERMPEMVTAAIEALRADYADRGVVLHEVAGGYQFRTNPINAHWVQQLVAGKPVKLSRAQLETLAICAYRQPITRPEIDEIRGVDSGATLKALLDRSLVRVLGKKEEAGRPMLYGTTKEFLEFFNLKDLKDLPTLREFYELNAESMEKIKKLDAQRAAEAAAKEHPPEDK